MDFREITKCIIEGEYCNELMYTGIYRENQWGESHHSSRGFRPSNHFGQFDRLDLSDGVDKARFEADRKGMLVARKETPSKNPLSSPDASNALQMDRQRDRTFDQDVSHVSNFQWHPHYFTLVLSRSYKDRNVSQSFIRGDLQENSRLYCSVGCEHRSCRLFQSGHRLYSSRGQCVLSFRRQFDETFVRQVLQTFRISQVKGDGLSSSDANDRYKENFRASQEILFSIQEHLHEEETR